MDFEPDTPAPPEWMDAPPEWLEAPDWLDGIDESDVLECPEQLAAWNDLGPLTVAETLLAASLVGPGPEAIGLLSTLRGQVLTDQEKLTAVQLWQPQLAWVTGAEQAAIIDLVGLAPDPTDKKAVLADEFAGHELAPALHVTPHHAAARIAAARLLHSTLKATGDHLRAGTLDPYRVWLITDTLTKLGNHPQAVTAAQQVEAGILRTAASMTGRQLRKALLKGCRQVDPDWGARMFAKNRKTRRVGFDFRGQDGLVTLYAALPPIEALAVKERLEQLAAVPSPAAGEAGDERCHDERMADALVTAILGPTTDDPTTPAPPQITLQVLVPLPTLLGLREDTAELIGYGDLPAEMAREMAGDAAWQLWITDATTGHLTDQGKHTYPPGAPLGRYLTDRDRECLYPGCPHPASNCDKDHAEPFDQQSAQDCPHPDAATCNPDLHPGGATSAANLGCLCRRTHRAKTLGHYQVRQDPDGTRHWTTPLGRHYTTHPWDYRPDSDRDRGDDTDRDDTDGKRDSDDSNNNSSNNELGNHITSEPDQGNDDQPDGLSPPWRLDHICGVKGLLSNRFHTTDAAGRSTQRG